MKRSLKKNLFIIFAFVVLLDVCIFAKKTFFKKNLVNIDKLSEKFMDNYFEEIGSVSDEDKDNMLIVISEHKIKDSYGATRVIEAPNHQFILQYDSEDAKEAAYEKLKDDRRVKSVDRNDEYKLYESSYNSWGIEAMSMDSAIDLANFNIDNMEPVTVAVIDTGCDMSVFNKHYPGKIAGFYNEFDSSTSIIDDQIGHGTSIASVIAEGTPSNVKIFPIKTTNSDTLYDSDIVAAINYIVYYEKADVINMSFGKVIPSESVSQAIDSAAAKNIICVVASGNDGKLGVNYPAAFETTIAVGSVDSDLNLSSFSNYGTDLDFVAPGSDVRVLVSSNFHSGVDFGLFSGTSLSAPHATAAVAILKSYNNNLTKSDVVDILSENAIDLGDEGWDQYYGNGLISFENLQFCDGTHCAANGVYASVNNSASSIEVTNLSFTQYNYYSLTNILGSSLTISYGDNTSEEFLFSDFSNLEISGYDPYTLATHTVTIKLGDLTTTVDVTNPSNYESAWEYNDLLDAKVEITGYKDHGLSINKLYIPSIIDSKHVVGFADNFKFSESGSDIDNYEYLYLPYSFTRIGDYVFADTNIKYVIGDAPKIEIGNHSFENSSIISISMPLLKAGDYAFKDCTDLISIDFARATNWHDSSEVSVGDYAFYGCESLVAVRFVTPGDYRLVGSVGDYAFYGCSSLSHFGLEVGEGIGEYAFYEDVFLHDIDISSITSIGEYAFYGSGITNVDFSISLDTISQSAFENCPMLRDVSFVGKRIESRAFWGSGVETIYISNNLQYISEDAFAYNPIKTSNGQTNGNGKYKSVYGLGIVEKSTNRLIVGFTDHLNISEDIVEIGDYAFTGNRLLQQVIIPESVTLIGEYSFKDCNYLRDVFILGDAVNFGENSFTAREDYLYLYVYNDSYVKQNAINLGLDYRHLVPDDIVVENDKEVYTAMSPVYPGYISVKLIYHEGSDRIETVFMSGVDELFVGYSTFRYSVIYQTENSDSIRYGDEYFTVEVMDAFGHSLTRQVEITVEKATPDYAVPTSITAVPGQLLSTVKLPSNFEWMDGNQTLNDVGTFTYKARYIPSDQNNYQIVEDVDIPVVVSNKTIIEPNIILQSKVYDGSIQIPFENVTVSNMNAADYTVESATSNDYFGSAGEGTAHVTLRLSDEKFENYAFSNGAQEKEFIVDFEILKGDLSSFIDDSSTDNIVRYDGNRHTILMHITYNSEFTLKYMDQNGEYTLNDIPRYSDVGTYVTKYKISYNRNYNDYYGEKTLYIQPFVSNYNVDYQNGNISNVEYSTELTSFTSNIILGYGYGIEAEYKSVNGKDILYTGAKARITHGLDLYKEYTVSVKGDLNGGGTVNATDMVSLRRYIKKVLNEENVDSCYILAGDFTGNGKINANDMIGLRNYIKEALSSDD